MRVVATALLAALLGTSCARSGGESAGTEPSGGSVTIWTDSTELFMEYPALVVARPARFAVHLTDLTDFAPLGSGSVTLHFVPRDGGEPTVVTQEGPRIAGIFGLRAEFGRPGVYDLVILVESPQAQDSIA